MNYRVIIPIIILSTVIFILIFFFTLTPISSTPVTPEDEFKTAVAKIEKLQRGDRPLDLDNGPDELLAGTPVDPYARYLTYVRILKEDKHSFWYECSNCKTASKVNDKFCSQCGTEFSSLVVEIKDESTNK